MVQWVLWGILLLGLTGNWALLQAKQTKKKGGKKSPFISRQAGTSPANGHPEVTSGDYVLGPEDMLTIDVWKEPELSSSVVIRPDGKISLPLISEIQASGLTSKQLQDEIAAKLKSYVASPVVTVMVREIRSKRVVIMGAVNKPGPYPLQASMTVVELISLAGGFRDYAHVRDIKIFRKEGEQHSEFRFNYKDYTNGKHFDQNIVLKNGDVVIVP